MDELPDITTARRWPTMLLVVAILLTVLAGSLYWFLASLCWIGWIIGVRLRFAVKLALGTLPVALMMLSLLSAGSDSALDRSSAVPSSLRLARCLDRDRPPMDQGNRTTCRALVADGRLCDDGNGPEDGGPEFFMGAGGAQCRDGRR
jgi:hypothetical protein